MKTGTFLILIAILNIASFALFYKNSQIQELEQTIGSKQETIVELNKEVYELRTELGINYSGGR